MVRHRIITPEQVCFHYEVAGLFSRAMAWALDQALLWALRITIMVSIGFSGGEVGLALIILLIFLLDFGYFVVCELQWSGQSVGKALMKIRVVCARGGRLRFAEVMIRNLLRPVDTLPMMMGLGGLVAFIDPLRRRLGDIAADTLVVRDLAPTLVASQLTQQARVNSFQSDPALRNRIMARVTREERDLILDLTLRRDQLQPTIREELFAAAAGHFRQRYSLPSDQDYLSDEQTVINLALVLQSTDFTS